MSPPIMGSADREDFSMQLVEVPDSGKIKVRPAFGLIADNVDAKKVTVVWFRRRLHEGLLLHPAVAVSDVWAVDSPHFSNRLREDDGDLFVQEGMVVIVRRDITPNLEAAFNNLQKGNIHGVDESQRAYVQHLDTLVRAEDMLTYELAKVGAGYRAMFETLMTEEALIGFDVTPDGTQEILRLFVAARDAGEKVFLRTWVYEQTMKPYEVEGAPKLNALSLEDCKKIWGPASAAYAFGLPDHLGFGVAAGDNFVGHHAVARLRGQMRQSAHLHLDTSAATNAAFQEVLGDPRIHWLFSDGVIENLSSSHLLAARSVSDRMDYLAAREIFLALPNDVTWRTLVKTLKAYLTKAAEEVLRLWIQEGRLGEDLKDASIVVEGSNILRLVIAPGNALEMSGVVPSPKTVDLEPAIRQVVATQILVPSSGVQDEGGSGEMRASSVATGANVSSGSSSGGSRARAPKIFYIRRPLIETPLAA